ncbi:MAG: hypothetical protein RPU73_03795, partial [Candidatus Sedimenticola sp. (ex Thyasira tokunagai)]
PAKKWAQAAKYLTFTTDQARTVRYGEYQRYEVHQYRTVYDLENGNVVNEQILYGSKRYIGEQLDPTENNIRNEIEYRTCYFGVVGC